MQVIHGSLNFRACNRGARGTAVPVFDIDAASVHIGQLVVGKCLDVYVVGSAFGADVSDLHNH